MKDYVVRAVAAGGEVRAFACTTKYLVEEARLHHDSLPVATAALGRLLSAGSMMGLMMKGENDRLTLQIKGDGPIGGLVVTADSKARVKGYVYNPDVELPLKSEGKLDVGAAVGSGELTVIRDMGLKEPYVGRTNLITGEIAEDLTYYFASSEETSFYCDCNKERVEQVLISIGEKDLTSLYEEDKPVEVCCQFCGKKYEFSTEEIGNLLKCGK